MTLRRWKRAEYERLIHLGAFRGEGVELIGGLLMVAEPQGSRHASVVGAIDDMLRIALPRGWIVRSQMPLALSDDSEPEPDLAVVAGTRADYLNRHPARPVLAIEVADSSLEFDREEKGSLYARAGIEDYWIVNLVDAVVEVYRDPAPAPAAPHGWRHRAVREFGRGSSLAPLALPAVRFDVSALLSAPA